MNERIFPPGWVGNPKWVLDNAVEEGVIELSYASDLEARGMAYRLHGQLRRLKADNAHKGRYDAVAVGKNGRSIHVRNYAHPLAQRGVKVTVGATE